MSEPWALCKAYGCQAIAKEGRIAYLENQLSATRAELAEARAILADFVRETDEWNASMEAIIGRPPGYCWQTLERARVLAPGTESTSEGGEK
jgi:hypothetical protein